MQPPPPGSPPPHPQAYLLEHLLLGFAQLLVFDLPLAKLPLQLLNVLAQSQLIPGEWGQTSTDFVRLLLS